MTTWIEPYSGLTFADRAMTVESAVEHHALTTCGIDPAVYGATVDPTTFISRAIAEGVRNGVHANGTVNMAQRLVQRAPLRLDEALTVSGKILEVSPVPRGKVAISETWFKAADGERAVMAGRRSLRPDPDKAGVRGAGDVAPPVVGDVGALKALRDVTLTPEMVKGYDSEAINPIHSVPEAAIKAGFRAPIIGGGMGVRYLMAEIWRRFSPSALDIEIYFRRPIFWDDTVTIRVAETGDRWTAICLAKGDKVATEARINAIGG
jgi:acyl-CoA thioesterase FadM